jgi:hypothetical protein
MAEQPLEFTEGEKGTQLINITHDDGTVYDLSQNGGYTVTMYVHEDTEDDAGDNIVDGEAVTIDVEASGNCTWPFDFSSATFRNTRGRWRCWLVSGDGTVKRFTRSQPFYGLRNRSGAS